VYEDGAETPQQKEISINIYADILHNIETDSEVLQNAVTCNEYGFFNTNQKVSANPCTVTAPVHQRKRKHDREHPNLKQ
jgi:hypothetical protein